RAAVNAPPQPTAVRTRSACSRQIRVTASGSSPSSWTSRTAPGSPPKTLTPGRRRESTRFAIRAALVVGFGRKPDPALVAHERSLRVEDGIGGRVLVGEGR